MDFLQIGFRGNEANLRMIALHLRKRTDVMSIRR
jgi:hypothetical protein